MGQLGDKLGDLQFRTCQTWQTHCCARVWNNLSLFEVTNHPAHYPDHPVYAIHPLSPSQLLSPSRSRSLDDSLG